MKRFQKFFPVCLLALALVICVTLLTPKAQAATSGTCGENLTWSVTSSGALTISGTGAMNDYTGYYPNYTPWTYSGVTIRTVTINSGVTAIGQHAFSRCTSLVSVSIPDTVTTIGANAFQGCTSLQSVALPNSVTRIEWDAFYNCSALRTITIPDSLEYIGLSAFYGCDSLRYNTYDNANYLGSSSNLYLILVSATAKDITSCNINTKTKFIYGQAFNNCSNLQDITIPKSVISIGSNAFWGCNSMQGVYITDLAAWCAIDFDMNGANPLMFAGNLYVNNQLVTNLYIPYGITSLGDGVFRGCNSIQTVYFPAELTSLGEWTFMDCENLTKFTVESSNPSFSSDSYGVLFNKDRTQLIQAPTTLEGHYAIPDTVTTISEYAFGYNPNLQSVTIPNSVVTIDSAVFAGCTGLTELVIPDSVTTIGGNAFSGCRNLARITIGSGVTGIGYYAFQSCYSLTEVYITDPSAWCKITYEDNYEGHPTYYVTNLHILDRSGNEVTQVILDDTVTAIPKYAFKGCVNLQSLTMPDSVTTIGEEAFHGCTGLEDVTISNNITSISDRAFYNCAALQSVTIPDSVTYIGYGAFLYCNSLQRVNIGKNVSTIQEDALVSGSNLKSFWVDPDNTAFSTDAYGALFNKDKTTLLNLPGSFSGHYIIPDSVLTVSGSAFYGCANLTDLTVPTTVTAFANYYTGMYGDWNYTFPTCTALKNTYFAGTESRWNVICNGYGSEYIAPTMRFGHTHDYTVFPPQTVEPTCTQDGYILYTCAYDLTDTYKEILPALGHNASGNTVTVEATCTTDGYIQATCSHCGQTAQTQVLPKLGHDYTGPEKRVLFCTENGYAGASCTRCDAIRNDRILEPAGHSMVLIAAKAPTCTEDGFSAPGSQCSRCETVFVEPTPAPALGHDYVEGTCSRCQAVDPDYVPPHIPGDFTDDGSVNNDDVVLLLWHVLFPTEYPLEMNADLNGDNAVNNDDVVLLLWHVLFPEEYPL